MLALLMVCVSFIFVFLLCFLFCFQTMKNPCFPCNSSGHVGYKVVYLLSFMSLFLFYFRVLFVSIFINTCVLFCVCVVWFSFFDKNAENDIFCTWRSCVHK